MDFDDFLKECAQTFPFEKIEMISKKDPKTFEMLRLKLMRLTTVEHALYVEDFHYHLFFKNYLPNFKRLSSAFFGNGLKGQFKNVPAIICGAGPSLSDEMETLKKLENKALILAGGSAIGALSNHGILPHLALAIDPNEEEYFRLRSSQSFEVPLLYGNRMHPKVFDTFNGPCGYLHTLTGGASELWLEEKLGIPKEPLQEGFDLEGMSVTTLALQLAYAIGCNPVILVGVDLAFTGQQDYAEGVLDAKSQPFHQREKEVRISEKLLTRADRFGKPVYTLIKWVMESSSIASFAKKNTATTLINATSGGIGIKGIPYMPLQEIPMKSSKDLRGHIHQEIERLKFSFSAAQVTETLLELKRSLEEGRYFIENALEELRIVENTNQEVETGKIIFCQMELEDKIGYQCFFQDVDRRLKATIDRKCRTSSNMKWHYLYSKWMTFDHLTTFYLDIFKNNAQA